MTEGASNTSDGSGENLPAVLAAPAADQSKTSKPTDLRIVRFFLLTLGVLLMGYAYLGRGFAHIGVGPVYVGEFVLVLGLVATGVAAVRTRLQTRRSWLVVVLVAFMAWGLLRTVPFIRTDGTDALRDGVLWGYAVFALMVFVLLDRDWVLKLFRLYGYMAIAFLFWGPVAYFLFTNYTVQTAPGTFVFSSSLIPNAPGSDVPILFFKAQDMAVQTAGAIAFLVVGTPLFSRVRDFIWRFVVALPASWMVYTTGAVTRGGLVAVAACVGLLGMVAARTRNWIPLIAGAVLFAAMVTANVTVPSFGPAPSTPVVVQSEPPIGEATLRPRRHRRLWSIWTTPRAATTTQWWDNILSIFFNSTNVQLQGTKQFRLDWWSKIVSYTFNGPYFWDGKGFGVNLAVDDGFKGSDLRLCASRRTATCRCWRGWASRGSSCGSFCSLGLPWSFCAPCCCIGAPETRNSRR